MEQQYIVNLVSEVDVSQRDSVAADVEARLGMPRAKVLKLLEQGTGPVTKPVLKAVADRVAGAMQAAGIDAESVPHNWQSFLLLDPPEQENVAAVNDAPAFDDSPLESFSANSTEPMEDKAEPLPSTDEPSIDPQVDAIGDGLKADEPVPSVTYSPIETNASHDGPVSEQAVFVTTEPADVPQAQAVPPQASGGPWRWLAPLLLLLIGLGLAYLYLPGLRPNQGEAALTNALEVSSEAEAQAPVPDTVEDESLADQTPLDEDVTNETSSEPLETSEQPVLDAIENEAEEADSTLESSEEAPTDTSEIILDDIDALTEEGVDLPEARENEELSDESAASEAVGEASESSLIERLITDAEDGKFEAQLDLAKRYAVGDGVSQDYAQSAIWYQRAAAAGDAGAQYELGWLYANGLGVERDLDEAINWYEAAAISGNAEAQYQLGFYRYYGQGGNQDLDEAKSLFSASAEQGVAEARFRLGVMLLEGEGGAVDEAEAERWLRLAAEQGIVEAEPYLEQLATNQSEPGDDDPALQEEPSFDDPNSVDELAADIGDELVIDSAVVPISGADNTEGVASLEPPAPLSAQDNAFFELVKRADTVSIADAVKAGANVNARDPYGQTPLMYAASFNSPNAIAVLIADSANTNAQSNAGWTALMYAARDNPDVVATLLNRGADPRLTNSDGQTALAIAQTTGSVATRLLAEATNGSN